MNGFRSPYLDAALEYITEGLLVFPLEPGCKTPIKGFKWRELASRDPEVVRGWWQRWPNANVAVVCGGGLTVLDVDVKDRKPGETTIARLLGADWRRRYRYVATPSGGAHLYMAGPECVEWGNHKLGQHGLDIQGEGSYVVAPPSRIQPIKHDRKTIPGVYHWAEDRRRDDELQALVIHAVADCGELHQGVMRLIASSGRDWSGERRGSGGSGGGGGEAAGYDPLEPPADWQAAELPAQVSLPPRALAFWNVGDAGHYDSDSEAVMACCHALQVGANRLSPEQCLRTVVDNAHCWAAATKPHRRPGGEDSAAQWLWAYGSVYKTIPHRIEEALKSPPPVAAQAAAEQGESIDWALAGGQLPSWLAPEPAPRPASTAADAGDGESPGVVQAVPAWEALLDQVDALEYGDVAGAEAVLAELTVMALEPHQEDLVLTRLADQAGLNRSALRSSLKRRKGAMAEEIAKARQEAPGGLSERYVYVESLDKVANLVEGTLVSPSAFANMHGEETRTAMLQGGALPRVGQATYFPLNAYSEAFRASEQGRQGHHWALVANEATGTLALNLWRPPRTTPDFADLEAARGPRGQALDRVYGELPEVPWAVAPWLRHMVRMGLSAGEVRHLVAYLAHACQEPGVKVNHMVLLGGVSGNGKDLLLAPLAVALGEGNVRQVRGNELESDFDPDITRAKVMMVSELGTGRWDAQRAERLYNTLKPYCAAPPEMLAVTLKGKGGMQIPNVVQVLAQTNYRNALPLDDTDRRVFAVWAGGTKLMPSEAREMWEWLDRRGGRRLVAAWLYSVDLASWCPQWDPKAPPPDTAWRQELLEDHLSAEAEDLGRMVREHRMAWARDGSCAPVGRPAVRLEAVREAFQARRAMRGERRLMSTQRFAALLDELGFRFRVRVDTHRRGVNYRLRLVVWDDQHEVAAMSPGELLAWVEGQEAVEVAF